MKFPKTFVPDKNLERKIKDLAEKSLTGPCLSAQEVEDYYLKFINSKTKMVFSVENLQDYFKGLSYEDALRIMDYEKRKRDRFLDGLADIP